MASISLLDADKRLHLRANWGADDDTLAIVRGLIEQRPPAGCAFTTHTLATGLHAICHDIASDPLTLPWRDEALARGYRALAVLPLTGQAGVLGAFSIYSGDAHVFDAEEMRLLDELATDISFALAVHAREAERQKVEQRFREVVENIREVFWVTDAGRTQMLYVSPAYETIWGRSRESLYAAPRSWLEAVPALNRAFLLEDFLSASGSLAIEALVFVQCEAAFEAFEVEAAWVAEQALVEPRIEALVAWAPLEKGRAVEADLGRLSRHAMLRGIRRIIQFEPDLDFCVRPDFIDGVRTLADFGLSFDICIDHRHLDNAIRLAEAAPGVAMILDHIGKPAIRSGGFEPWASGLGRLAALPHVSCKISGVATEADHAAWREDDLRRYIDHAIECFGFDRVMFGGDWPVATQAIGYQAWVSLLDRALAGVAAEDRDKFWRGNAARIYRLAA